MDFDSGLNLVKVANQKISMVLLYIYKNAFYGVSERLRQTSDPNYQPKVKLITRIKSDQLAIQIQVKDNEFGIPGHSKGKFFQSFFTTKSPGVAAGLSLSLSYNMVTKVHEGSLSMKSRKGKGSEFIITLPIS